MFAGEVPLAEKNPICWEKKLRFLTNYVWDTFEMLKNVRKIAKWEGRK